MALEIQNQVEHSKTARKTQSLSSGLRWLKRKLALVDEGATPPNWKYIGLVFMALFSSASTLTFLFPFLPEMILTFGYDETEKGIYAGMVASCVFGGRIFGSVFWGWLADRKGRKIVLLITIALNGTFAGLFGFSSNLPMAMFFRFMCGVVNGTIGTAKTILYDVSDNTNQAISMTMLSISFGLGMILGPTVGGVLASPAEKWPDLFSQDGIFGQFPYLLPSLFPFFSCFFIFLLILVKFDETFVVESSKRDKQELEIEEDGELADTVKEKKNHLPLLGGMSRNDSNSLLRLGQSMQSVNLEAESAAFLALQSERRHSKDSQELQPLTLKVQSVPDIARSIQSEKPKLHSFISVDESKTFYSLSGINQLNLTNGDGCQVKSNPGDINLDCNSVVDSNSCEKANIILQENQSKNSEGKYLSQSPQSNISITIVSENGVSENRKNSVCEKEKHEEITMTNIATEQDKLLVNGKGNLEADRSVLKDYGIKEEAEEEETLCKCILCCFKPACCVSLRRTSLYKLMRLSDVWATIMLYSVLSFATISLEDIFPVFASTRKDYVSVHWCLLLFFLSVTVAASALCVVVAIFGIIVINISGGLGFSTDEIGIAIGAVTIPLLLVQVKLYPFMVSKMGIRKVFLFFSVLNVVFSQMIPTVRLLNEHPVWLWVALFCIQIPFRISTNSCFAGTALLINNSVTQDLAGQANGLAMMTTACGRTLAPILAGSLFSWTVTYGPILGTPFDTSFPFFVLGLLFIVTIFECLHLNPSLDKQKKNK